MADNRPKEKIALVDDHNIVRISFKALIEDLGPYSVDWQFKNGQELIDALNQIKEAKLIILDLSMPVLNGIETLQKLKELGFKTPVLALTFIQDDLDAIRVFRLGARGYLSKDCSDEELKEAIQEILRSGYYHNQYFRSYMISDQKKSPREKILDSLTAKEKLFLRLVCDPKELNYNEIAVIMKTTMRAVDRCRENIFEKFGIKSKAGLVLFVYKYRLLAHLEVN
jgi:two-component system, NarL family, invasion response regulator UvrY